MKTLLFVNACMRGPEKSRTYELAKSFLESVSDKYIVETLDLNEIPLQYLNKTRLASRDALLAKKEFQDKEFDLARQFAAADRVLIAAPFWDLSVPAALKVYIENITAVNIVFKYDDSGMSQGLCKAEKLLFVITCGANLEDDIMQKFELATPYIQGLCKMFGIEEFDCLLADGLDIYGADVAGKLKASKLALAEKAEAF